MIKKDGWFSAIQFSTLSIAELNRKCNITEKTPAAVMLWTTSIAIIGLHKLNNPSQKPHHSSVLSFLDCTLHVHVCIWQFAMMYQIILINTKKEFKLAEPNARGS